MQGFLIILIVLVIVIGLYIGTYVLNSNTKTPEGAKTISGCEGCQTLSCTLHSNPDPKEECEQRTE